MNADVVISPPDIELSEKSGILHVVNQLRNEGERVSIVNGVAVKIAIILTRAKSSILLWDEEEWGSLWGLGGYNLSCLQIFIDESFTSFLFSSVKRVDLGDLRGKRVFEFNGVVEESMRGKDIISLLREDICKVNAEIRDRDLLEFVNLGKLC